MAKRNVETSVEEKLRTLFDLQFIDSKLDEIRGTRGELPIEVEDLEIDVEGLNKRISKTEAEIKELNAEISNKEEVINHAKSLIEKYKTQQDNVRNNKEFETLSKEIEFQELEIQLAQKRIREFETKISHKNDILSQNQTKVAELRSHLDFKKSKLDTLIAETQKEEEFLLKKSKEYAEKLDERLLASYHRIRRNSANGLAVVGIERGAPKGSYFTIPAQKLVELAQRKKVIIDEHSGKILVDDELVSEETTKMSRVIKF